MNIWRNIWRSRNREVHILIPGEAQGDGKGAQPGEKEAQGGPCGSAQVPARRGRERRRGNGLKWHQGRLRVEIGKENFPVRVVRIGMSCPGRFAVTVCVFRSRLDGDRVLG